MPAPERYCVWADGDSAYASTRESAVRRRGEWGVQNAALGARGEGPPTRGGFFQMRGERLCSGGGGGSVRAGGHTETVSGNPAPARGQGGGGGSSRAEWSDSVRWRGRGVGEYDNAKESGRGRAAHDGGGAAPAAIGENVCRPPGEPGPGEDVRLPVSKREGRLPLPISVERHTSVPRGTEEGRGEKETTMLRNGKEVTNEEKG
ncbi:hypothetical protein JB92DRAFT_2825455 [Gautieria morchelliformis]|nr:hypothetical protein JB92DRAFT_2825455 [Gautieria morchelliformis]